MRENWKVRTIACLSFLVIAGILVTPARSDDKSAATYKQRCVACHGADGKGDTPTGKAMGIHSFGSPEVAKMSDEELAGIIEKGKGKMPKYGSSLKPDEIKAMVTYVRTLGK